MKRQLAEQLAALAGACREVQSEYLTDDCCIAATRAGIEVLTRLGVRKARPLLVASRAGNREFAAGGRLPPAAYIAVDCDYPRPGHIAGHLIILGKAQGAHFLLDLSAYQMDRPAKGIHVPAGVVFKVDGTPPEDRNWSLKSELPGGGEITYSRHPHPARVPWQSSPNWRLPTPGHRATFTKVVDGLLRAARSHHAST